VSPMDFQDQVVEMMERELVDLRLFTAKEAKEQGPEKALLKKYYPHSTSHHMGLDVHDVSPAHEPFAVGMVMTIEPGIYIREEGFGIRLEDDFLIGQNGNLDLMADIPIEADEIEALMQSNR
jgi:Xaa-Pro aminopeptidase